MITLSINGIFREDEVYQLKINDDVKLIDQFSKCACFSLPARGNYRIYFEQKRTCQLPKCIGIPLMILCFPFRGLFNILTFNSENNWEKETTAFRLAGYIDIDICEDSEIKFRTIQSYYDQNSNVFIEPSLQIDSPCDQTMQNIWDDIGIRQKYNAFLKNLISVSIWFYVLFGYLFSRAVYGSNRIAIISVGVILLLVSCIIIGLIAVNHKKMKKILHCFELQRHKERM